MGDNPFIRNSGVSYPRISAGIFPVTSTDIYGQSTSTDICGQSTSNCFSSQSMTGSFFKSSETFSRPADELSPLASKVFPRTASLTFPGKLPETSQKMSFETSSFPRMQETTRCTVSETFQRTYSKSALDVSGGVAVEHFLNETNHTYKISPETFLKNSETENFRKSCAKALMPIISSHYLTDQDSSLMENLDCGLPYDPNRRSSLGAESLLEHDIEEGNVLESEGLENLLYAEAQLGLEYADDIFILYRNREKIFHPKICMADQPQVTEFMRCTLIHWLTKVNHQLKFGPETIFLAVSLTDRFLASTPIAQDCLQLLATCALFVAAKLEESAVPGISALVTLCGSTYRHHHFRRMEKLLLSTLGFELHAPTSWFFVTNLMLKTCQLTLLDRRMLSLARYAVETCLGSYDICQFLPSEQAAAAVSYSHLVLYSPATIQTISSSDSSPDEKNNLHNILSLNSSGTSLIWVFYNVYSSEEFKNIYKCVEKMITYMEPFIQSLSLDFGSTDPSTITSSIQKQKESDEPLVINSCQRRGGKCRQASSSASVAESSLKPSNRVNFSPGKERKPYRDKSSPNNQWKSRWNKASPAKPLKYSCDKSSPAKPLKYSCDKSSPAKPRKYSWDKSSPAKPRKYSWDKSSPAKPRKYSWDKSSPTKILKPYWEKSSSTKKLKSYWEKSSPNKKLKSSWEKSSPIKQRKLYCNKYSPTELRNLNLGKSSSSKCQDICCGGKPSSAKEYGTCRVTSKSAKHCDVDNQSQQTKSWDVDSVESEPNYQRYDNMDKSEPSNRSDLDWDKSRPGKQWEIDWDKSQPRTEWEVDWEKSGPSKQCDSVWDQSRHTKMWNVDWDKSYPSNQLICSNRQQNNELKNGSNCYLSNESQPLQEYWGTATSSVSVSNNLGQFQAIDVKQQSSFYLRDDLSNQSFNVVDHSKNLSIDPYGCYNQQTMESSHLPSWSTSCNNCFGYHWELQSPYSNSQHNSIKQAGCSSRTNYNETKCRYGNFSNETFNKGAHDHKIINHGERRYETRKQSECNQETSDHETSHSEQNFETNRHGELDFKISRHCERIPVTSIYDQQNHEIGNHGRNLEIIDYGVCMDENSNNESNQARAWNFSHAEPMNCSENKKGYVDRDRFASDCIVIDSDSDDDDDDDNYGDDDDEDVSLIRNSFSTREPCEQSSLKSYFR